MQIYVSSVAFLGFIVSEDNIQIDPAKIFVTELPPSQGYTTILTVDRFSKMVHFIPMRKLPSAKGTAEAVLSQVFWINCFPKDLVSDQGTSVHFTVLEDFLFPPWRHGQSLLRISSPVKRPGGVAESGTGELPTVPCLPESSQNPATWSKHLIWVEFSHPTQFIYRLFSISVCLWLPASTIPRSRDGGQHPLCPEVHPLMPLDLKWGL